MADNPTVRQRWGVQGLLLREARDILRHRGAELGVADRPGAEPDRRRDGVGVRGGNPDANIASYPDALWWAVTTITTVGYGDRFPMSSPGRAVAVVLMIAGIAMFG
jgi:voltage-gated potassium channel Kch